MCIAEVIAVTKDAVLAVGAIVGSYVALRGLNTWNRQLKGGAEYDPYDTEVRSKGSDSFSVLFCSFLFLFFLWFIHC